MLGSVRHCHRGRPCGAQGGARGVLVGGRNVVDIRQGKRGIRAAVAENPYYCDGIAGGYPSRHRRAQSDGHFGGRVYGVGRVRTLRGGRLPRHRENREARRG